ncbi:hypothetical protein TVAG_118060 [Trichomonas vaginalis G3]|uniref:Uncharacterized protein n=1 Tax=Trichomonas vaginalis (strain ATCC PRA-98 / G3) TaxID=412133 RepID=A2EHZ3_TRIV3|nr:hypothetical protein TVAG_118060 [Trichomonas vaginalis G3]|eukprot:XP_001319948.1 hypothetical protein [Trichomonas vaginalis G3]
MSSSYEEEDFSGEVLDVDQYLDQLPDHENAEVIKEIIRQNQQSMKRRNEAIKFLKQHCLSRKQKIHVYKQELKERNDAIETRDQLIEKKHEKIHAQAEKIKNLEKELHELKSENSDLATKANSTGLQLQIKQLEFQEALKDKLIAQLTAQLTACQEAVYNDRVKIYNAMNKEPESTVEPPEDFIENIHLAAKKGDLKSLEYLIDRFPDAINAISEKPILHIFINVPLYISQLKQDKQKLLNGLQIMAQT